MKDPLALKAKGINKYEEKNPGFFVGKTQSFHWIQMLFEMVSYIKTPSAQPGQGWLAQSWKLNGSLSTTFFQCMNPVICKQNTWA